MLNLVANMIRILVLVYFDIRPENKMHEVTGLICLAIYVLLPSLWIIQLLIKKWGIKAVSLPTASLPTPKTSRFLLKHISLALLLACSSIYICRKNNRPIPHSLPQVSGYIGAYYDSDVIQYRNASALVYIKKINGVFSAEHNPAMCWLGSGYIFESIDQASFQGVAVYTGILKKGNERLYTAWWFDNGHNRTLGQLDWRWEVLKGSKPYSVVNVTAADKRLLNEEIYKIISRGIFKPAL
jgi:exosortase N